MIAGCDAYADGEYLYQDYVYDDHGADARSWGGGSPADSASLGGVLSQSTGDYHYPNDPGTYGYNAADLLEFRARPTDDGVAYRITLNTMLEPDAAAVAVGLWDADAGEFEQIAVSPDGETPGGARENDDLPPVFNVGFRFDEPYRRNLGPVGLGRGLFDLVDVTGLGHNLLDLFLDRSPRVLGEGIDVDHDILEGRVQPYNVYLPEDIEEPAPLVLLLHSLSCSYTQYAVYTPNLLQSLAEETGAIIMMP
jgi:hypothetical protein